MDAVERLGELLRDAGFGGAQHAALAEHPRLAQLVAFFGAEPVQPVAQARALLAPLALEELIEAGVVAVEGDEARARVMLAAISGAIVAGDLDGSWGTRDFVAGISPTGKAVAYATVRRPCATALDLGSGSGIQALLAARHADHVTAVDVNAHALDVARLGARLDGVRNITWVQGSWDEPVRGRQFDLVVCNPPVVISPAVVSLARDSELGGEGISRRIVRDAAALLADGGYATVLCNWTHAGEDWQATPRAWLRDSGCDALVLHFSSPDLVTYAMIGVGRAGQETAARVEQWVDYYAGEAIERIAIGAIVMRKRSGANWVRGVEAPSGPSAPGGEQLARMFAGGDVLAAGDEALLASRWVPVDGHRLEQSLVFDGAFTATAAVLTQPGLNVSARIDAQAAALVTAIDGRATVGELLAAYPAGRDAVVELIAKGFLVSAPA